MTKNWCSVQLIAVSVLLSAVGMSIACSNEIGSRNNVIDFLNTGQPAAQQAFQDGVHALHSFWYGEARDRFLEAQRLDPEFGLAYWGEAMTWDNAFLSEPGFDNELRGTEVVSRIVELDSTGLLRLDNRERELINTLGVRFAESLDRDERRLRYSAAMEELERRFPDDVEIALFAALATMARPGFDRNRPEHVTTVASSLETIFKKKPDHPGVLHYLIHVYDSPAFAYQGLRQARLYADVAPASSHALHMPSHIYRHLGLWEEVAASNEAAWAASVAWQEHTGRGLAARDYHALEWLFDASLELGDFKRAGTVVSELEDLIGEMEKTGEAAADMGTLLSLLQGYLHRAQQD